MDTTLGHRSWSFLAFIRTWGLALGSLMALSGCLGDDSPVELPFLEEEDNVLVEMFEVEYVFSDSARLTAVLTAGRVAERKPEEGEEAHHDLSGGVKVVLYDGNGRVNGTIRSDSAVFYSVRREALLYHNVTLVNYKNDRLATDQLTWSQHKDSIYTPLPVHIVTTAQDIVARNGLKATADFSAYDLFGTSGEVEVDESSDL